MAVVLEAVAERVRTQRHWDRLSAFKSLRKDSACAQRSLCQACVLTMGLWMSCLCSDNGSMGELLGL